MTSSQAEILYHLFARNERSSALAATSDRLGQPSAFSSVHLPPTSSLCLLVTPERTISLATLLNLPHLLLSDYLTHLESAPEPLVTPPGLTVASVNLEHQRGRWLQDMQSNLSPK